jgi:hypothetical protein
VFWIAHITVARFWAATAGVEASCVYPEGIPVTGLELAPLHPFWLAWNSSNATSEAGLIEGAVNDVTSPASVGVRLPMAGVRVPPLHVTMHTHGCRPEGIPVMLKFAGSVPSITRDMSTPYPFAPWRMVNAGVTLDAVEGPHPYMSTVSPAVVPACIATLNDDACTVVEPNVTSGVARSSSP